MRPGWVKSKLLQSVQVRPLFSRAWLEAAVLDMAPSLAVGSPVWPSAGPVSDLGGALVSLGFAPLAWKRGKSPVQSFAQGPQPILIPSWVQYLCGLHPLPPELGIWDLEQTNLEPGSRRVLIGYSRDPIFRTAERWNSLIPKHTMENYAVLLQSWGS